MRAIARSQGGLRRNDGGFVVTFLSRNRFQAFRISPVVPASSRDPYRVMPLAQVMN
jgi:hypothetical protein